MEKALCRTESESGVCVSGGDGGGLQRHSLLSARGKFDIRL